MVPSARIAGSAGDRFGECPGASGAESHARPRRPAHEANTVSLIGRAMRNTRSVATSAMLTSSPGSPAGRRRCARCSPRATSRTTRRAALRAGWGYRTQGWSNASSPPPSPARLAAGRVCRQDLSAGAPHIHQQSEGLNSNSTEFNVCSSYRYFRTPRRRRRSLRNSRTQTGRVPRVREAHCRGSNLPRTGLIDSGRCGRTNTMLAAS
jgi:hypothetical protein